MWKVVAGAGMTLYDLAPPQFLELIYYEYSLFWEDPLLVVPYDYPHDSSDMFCWVERAIGKKKQPIRRFAEEH